MSLLKRIGGSDGLGQAPPPPPPAAAAQSAPLPAPAPPGAGTITGRMAGPPPAPVTTSRFAPNLAPSATEPSRRPATAAQDSHRELKDKVQAQLISELDPKLDLTKTDEVRRQVEEIFNSILETQNIPLSRVERARLFEAVAAEILGLGPIQPLMDDSEISEILVNGPRQVYIERRGKLELTNVQFQDDNHVMRIIERIISPLGRRIDESSPMVDARTKNGSRVNAIIPPLALNGPTISIRKFSKDPFKIEDYIRFGTVTPEMATFLKACVQVRLNIVVSGGTGSGKTTCLNILSDFIPPDERIVTIENAAELQLRQDHVVTLESKPANIEGKGEITINDLVINALRMRPDRIVVGECRGKEALAMLQAMNTGHDGSMTTLHANTARDAVSRLETMVLMAGFDLPAKAIREQIAAAVDLIIQLERMKDGTRKVVSITEVQGMEGDVVVLQDVFKFEQTGIEDNKIIGRLKPTGIRPKFVENFDAAGIYLPPKVFGVSERFF
jgi:pilus assembly protein CpaF